MGFPARISKLMDIFMEPNLDDGLKWQRTAYNDTNKRCVSECLRVGKHNIL